MKFAIFSLTLIISNVIATSSIDISFKNQLLQIEFDSWAGEHGKKYEKNEDRKDRFGVWRRNHEFIENHNNQFSDMTHEEFKEHFHLNSLTEDVFPTNVIDSS